MQKIIASFHAKRYIDFAKSSVDKNLIEATNTQPSWDCLKLSVFGIIDQKNKKQNTCPTVLNSKHWCMASNLAKLLDMPELISALAVFVKK